MVTAFLKPFNSKLGGLNNNKFQEGVRLLHMKGLLDICILIPCSMIKTVEKCLDLWNFITFT